MTDRIEIPLNNTTERTGHGNQHPKSPRKRKARSQRAVLRSNRRAWPQRNAHCLGPGDRLPEGTGSKGTGSCACVSTALRIGPCRLRSSTTTRTTRRSNARRTALIGFISRRLLVWFGRRTIRRPQIGPIDVRAKILAAHTASGCPFDGRAALSRHRPFCLYPLIDGRRLNPKRPRQRRLTTNEIARRNKGLFIHGPEHKVMPYVLSIGIA